MEHLKTLRRMPKDFSQPLTCFYWATYGSCNNSDNECLYAHYKTGVVAAAPVSFHNSKGPVAGHNATNKLENQSKREQHLQEWESRLQAKEMQLHGRRVEATACTALRQAIATGRVSACRVRDALREIEQFPKLKDTESVSNSIAQATEAVDTLGKDLDGVLKLLDEKQAKY